MLCDTKIFKYVADLLKKNQSDQLERNIVGQSSATSLNADLASVLAFRVVGGHYLIVPTKVLTIH